jgi:hypothetical protein
MEDRMAKSSGLKPALLVSRRRNPLADAAGRSQDFLHRSQQLGGGKRLEQHGAESEPWATGEFMLWRGSGDHDDRQGHFGVMQLLEQFNAVHLRHAVIGDQQVEIPGLKGFPGDGAVLGGLNPVAGTNQRLGAESADVRVVIHHENAVQPIRLGAQESVGQQAGLVDIVIIHRATYRRGDRAAPWGVFLTEIWRDNLTCVPMPERPDKANGRVGNHETTVALRFMRNISPARHQTLRAAPSRVAGTAEHVRSLEEAAAPAGWPAKREALPDHNTGRALLHQSHESNRIA